MSLRRVALGIFAIITAAAPALAGGDPDSAWGRFWLTWHRNNCWPEPFVHPDRASVWIFLDLETARGWEQQNLLGAPHFDGDGSKLSSAGVAKIKAILTQSPPQYRTVFVEEAWDGAVTARRLEAAQREVETLVQGAPPAVIASNLRLEGTPADYVNTVNTKFIQSMPDPKLPPPQDGAEIGTGN